MTTPLMDMELRAKDEASHALVTVEQVASAIERLATNPAIDVVKLEKVMELHERLLRQQAKAAFDAAFAAMQGQMPVIVEHARTDKSTYAPLEDIVQAVRPILATHGFALSHRTEWPEKNVVRIVGILAHRQGHERTSEFLSAADASGSKNAIQGLASAISYGRRYTTSDVLNIVTRGEDDDARLAGRVAAAVPIAAPDGFDSWLTDMAAVADEGLPALQAAWQQSPKEHKEHLTKTDARTWNQLKTKAAKVQGVST